MILELKKNFLNKFKNNVLFRIFVFFLSACSLFILILFGSTHKPFQKFFWQTRILQLLRKAKILGTSELGFFEALKTQNLLYDYNNDGFVTGEDYSLMLAEKKDGVLPGIFVTQSAGSAGENPLDRSNFSLPTVKGFSTNEFDGSANVDYPLDLPAGPGGLTPKLALSYSSSSVDDMNVGVHTVFRSSYQRQAGLVGLGWNLSGMSYISRDFNNTTKNPTDDKFILSFEGGSANLTLESGDENYSVWRTSPNLKLKIERYGKCYAVKLFAYPSCRHTWIVTTGDGTKYIFGSDKLLPQSQWAQSAGIRGPSDPDSTNFYNKPYWYPLYETVNGVRLGTREWITLSEHSGKETYYSALTSKWLLTRVESKYYKPGINDTKIDYQYRFELTTSNSICQEEFHRNPNPFKKLQEKGGSALSDWHTKSVYPYKITYGKNAIDFSYEDRYDYLLGSYTWICSSSDTAFLQRMKKISISSLGKVRNIYKLDYDYGWKPKDHSTKIIWHGSTAQPQVIPNWNNLNCSVEINKAYSKKLNTKDMPEVVDNQPIHSLLVRITEYADDPDKNPQAKRKPSSAFSYGDNCNDYCGGCPLTSFFDPAKPTEQIQTGNDFFLKKADNGSGGSTTFEYWNDGKGNSAIPVKYCYNKTDGTSSCLMDLTENTQRHRIISKTTSDGMGNTYKISYNYPGIGASQGLAYVESPFTEWCENTKDGKIVPYDPSALYKNQCKTSSMKGMCLNVVGEACSDLEYKSTDLPGYEFLGYPEVETTSYQKNSITEIAAKSKKNYYQVMQTSTCFKPSPLKGVAYKTTAYDTTASNRFNESIEKYKVRFGKMFDKTNEVDDVNLSQQCPIYEPKTTVSLVLSTESVFKDYVNGSPVLCTKSSRDYDKLDGSSDPYAQLRKETTWGKVDCNDTGKDIDDGTAIVSVKDYTQGKNDAVWRVPLPNESWTQGYQQTEKYNYNKTYYDSKPFGILGEYGNATKNETIVNGSVYATTLNAFDDNYPWLLTQTTDPLGRTAKTEYDTVYHLYPVKVTNALGQVLKTDHDFSISDKTHPNYQGNKGLVVKTTDANNQETTLVYDQFGRLLDTYLPGNKPVANKPNSSNRYFYFNENDISPCNETNNCMNGLGKQVNGQISPKLVVLKTTRFDDEGLTGRLSASYYFYDGLGQQIQTRSTWYDGSYADAGLPVEGEGNKDLVTSKNYNALGNTELETLPYTDTPYVFSAKSPYLARNIVTDQTIKKTMTTYDGLGRAVKLISPDGTFTETDYDVDGDPLKTKSLSKNCTDNDPGTLCTYGITIKDAFGRSIEQQSVDTSANKIYTTKNEYHPVLGTVTKTIDTLGNTTSVLTYDSLGRKISMWDVDMAPSINGDQTAWKYEYDLMGNLVKQTDPKGQTSTLIYDALNRVITKKANNNITLENTYDACSNGVGKLCKFTSYDPLLNKPIYTKDASYDNRGRTKKETYNLSNMPDDVINRNDFSIEYTYDEGNRTLTANYSGNSDLKFPQETISNIYDHAYLVSGSSSHSGIYIKETKFNKYGQILSFKTGDNILKTFSYDENNQRMTGFSLSGPSTGTLARLSYNYNPIGNITNITDGIKNSTDPLSLSQNFSYDGLNRLIDVAGAYSAKYSYDDLNNIITKNEGSSQVTLSYGDINSSYYHRPQTANSFNLRYDALGNLTNYQDTVYTYDSENRLVSAAVNQTNVLGVVEPGSRKTKIQLPYLTPTKIPPSPTVTIPLPTITVSVPTNISQPTGSPISPTITNLITGTPQTFTDSLPEGFIRFYYTSDGQRIAKIDPTVGENTYYLNPDFEVVVKKDGVVSSRRNFFMNGQIVAVRTNE